MRSKTLNKIITEEIENLDISERIRKMSFKNQDINIKKKLLRMQVLEMWEKTFPRSKEEIERYNDLQKKYGRSSEQISKGYNLIKLAIASYSGDIPNGCIKLPEEHYETFKQYGLGMGVQPQIILGEEAIIFRNVELPYDGIKGDLRTENKLIMGKLSYSARNYIVDRNYETILKNTISSFLDEPNDFSQNHFSHTHRTDNHAFHYVVLVPESHLSFDNWWKENKQDIEECNFPEKDHWLNTPLIYGSVLKNELEKANYTRIIIKN